MPGKKTTFILVGSKETAKRLRAQEMAMNEREGRLPPKTPKPSASKRASSKRRQEGGRSRSATRRTRRSKSYSRASKNTFGSPVAPLYSKVFSKT
jgi:hypothetical protein